MRILPPMSRAAWMFLVLAVVAGLLLQVVPAIDRGVAALFFDGTRFPADGDRTVQFLRRLAHLPGYLLGAAIVVSIVRGVLAGRAWLGLDRKAIAFLLLVAVAAPVVLVNGILKEHWGRARPSQTEGLGGTRQFTPPFVPADQCARNCSFVSGEASFGFYFVALGFLVAAPARRRAVFAAATLFGAGVSLIRIAQGGHYLSDVAFAGVFTVVIAWLLHHWIVREDAFGRLFARSRPAP